MLNWITDTKIPVGKTAEMVFKWMQAHMGGLFDAMSIAMEFIIDWIEWLLQTPPPIVIIALFVALVLVTSAWGVFRQSLDQLMDHELPDADRARIIAMVRAHPEIRSLHELKTRRSGLTSFIQVHIELDPDMSLARAHAISDGIEHALCAAFPNSEVIIHQDPAGLEDIPEVI